MTEEAKVYEPCVSQKQADMFHHASHNEEYAASRKLTVELAEGKHAANVAAGRFGKREDGLCPKCNPDCDHNMPAEYRDADGLYCSACGAVVDANDGQSPSDSQGDAKTAAAEAEGIF